MNPTAPPSTKQPIVPATLLLGSSDMPRHQSAVSTPKPVPAISPPSSQYVRGIFRAFAESAPNGAEDAAKLAVGNGGVSR